MLLKDAIKIAKAKAVHEHALKHGRKLYQQNAEQERKRSLNYQLKHKDIIVQKVKAKRKLAGEAKESRDVVIVDVDDTLYSFASEMCRAAKTRGRHVCETDLTCWGAWDNFLSSGDWNEILDEIHRMQTLYRPYEGAKELLDYLFENYYVIIASHRKKEMKVYLSKWLEKNNLKHHKVLVFDHTSGKSKTDLFKRADLRGKVKLVIDDNPEVLSAAKSAGITAVGLSKPWNLGNGFTLFKNLRDIEEFVSYVRLREDDRPGYRAVAF